MPIALRNLKTGMLLGPGGWTADLLLAQYFRSEQEVVNAAIEHKIEKAEMVIIEGKPPRIGRPRQIVGGVSLRIAN